MYNLFLYYPCRMPFQFPAEFQKPLENKNTIKVYKSKLNKLASEGWDTIDKLRTNPTGVILTLDKLIGSRETDKDRHKYRAFLSAIFWVVPGLRDKKNGYYIFWQKVIPHKVDGTDNKWVKRTQYQPAE